MRHGLIYLAATTFVSVLLLATGTHELVCFLVILGIMVAAWSGFNAGWEEAKCRRW